MKAAAERKRTSDSPETKPTLAAQQPAAADRAPSPPDFVARASAAVGTLISLIALAFSWQNSLKTNAITASTLLDQAWDALGGAQYTSEINSLKPTLGALEQAERSVRQAEALDRPTSRSRYITAAIQLARGHHDKAMAIYDHLLRDDPEYINAYIGKALLLRDKGELSAALNCLDGALRLGYRNINVYSNRGVVLKELGNLPAALAMYNAAIGISPHHVGSLTSRASARLALGMVDDALRDATTAVRLAPQLAAAHYNRGIALSALGRWTEALEEYDATLRCDPSHANAATNRAQTFLGARRPSGAADGVA